MSITINERLNLVVPLESGKGYVHCPPLSRDAFALCWKLLARTWSSLESDELGITAGAAVAAFALKEQAEQAGPEGETTYTSLLADINRNATYIGVSDEGFDPIPLSSALKKGWLNEEERAEVENALIFFIVASALLPAKRKKFILDMLNLLRSVDMTSLDATAYKDSLPSLTTGKATGETEAA
ncbi:hypothetical protein PT277_05325 [Acetobacteraceae bacterium ESL0709]|nr:hypothetical protein [Acetobacteraceae bacterium ESL0697]MDF7678117.1 hypothetical protein [Acetobacteraceae bacterium ESL0709]